MFPCIDPVSSSCRLTRFLSSDISYAQTPQIRWQAVQDLRRILSLDGDESGCYHEAAIGQGADRLLAWRLTCLLQETVVDLPILLAILVCMELLWARCRYDHLKRSEQGLCDVLTWLVHVWQRFPGKHNIVEVVVSILRNWSKIKEPRLKSRLIRSGLLQCIRHEASGEVQSERRKAQSLGLLKDLTFRSSSCDREFLYTNMRIVILEICQGEIYGDVEEMSVALWNLASELSVARKMAEDRDLWKTLHHLWSCPVETNGIAIHRNTSSTVGTIVASIAGSDGSPVLLEQQTWLLPALLHVLSSESDNDWKRRCMRTIRCLASCEWGRDFLWARESSVEDFVTVLVRVLQNVDESTATRVQACQAIASILPFQREVLTPLGPCLESSLIQIFDDLSADETLVLAASETLSACLCHSPWKRAAACFTVSLMERIRLTLENNSNDPLYHTILSALMVQLLKEPATQKRLSSFASTPVLNSVAILLQPVGPDFDQSRKNTLEVVAALSSESISRKLLAANEGLLTSLVNFCLISNGPLKDVAKSAILALVPEL
jgi:hypothetical protein